MSKFTNFLKMSGPSEKKVPAEKQDKVYKSLRFQTFVAGTIGYSLYYVCRTSLNVVKKPIIDSGMLDASQLGLIGCSLNLKQGETVLVPAVTDQITFTPHHKMKILTCWI